MTLPPVEWNFEKVPDDELAACCVWEYARESETLQRHSVWVQWWWESQSVQPIPNEVAFVENPPEVQQRAREYLRQAEQEWGYKADRLRDEILGSDLSAAFGSASRVPHRVYWFLASHGILPDVPWLSLPRDFRKELARLDASPVGFASAHDIRDFLRHHKKAISPHDWLRAADARDQMALVLREFEPLPPAQPQPGHMTVAFTINWKSFTPTEIKRKLTGWVDSVTPPHTPAFESKGNKNWPARLRDLGVMRLQNFSTVAAMPVRCKEAAERYKRWESKHWSAARKRALKNFRCFLPFLPKGELPIHAKSKGGRANV
jgi:hypothetical protein